MIPNLFLTAEPAQSAQPTVQDMWNEAVKGVKWFFTHLSPAFAWAVLGILICGGFFVYYWLCLRPRPHSLEWIAMSEERETPKRLSLTLPCHPMERRDALPLLALTAVYAFTAFFQLGSFSAPQSMVKFQQSDEYYFSYDQPVTVDKVSYYTSLGTGYYSLWWVEDGEWRSIRPEQPYNSLFKWKVLDLTSNVDQDGLEIKSDNKNEGSDPIGPITSTRFCIIGASVPRDEGLWLSELALWSGDQLLTPSQVDEGAEALFDEQNLASTKTTYMNSSYFDEIYHPRTALEHLNNVYPYEVSHPPLGKLILSVGIAIFGMVPFGWRFMGTLFGVLMVPVLYIFLKNLFGKTSVALCGAALFTFDFMHLVQTRIATIDTYGVFFILVSYYFMYRWLAVPAGKKLRHYLLPLFLCGLFWGIGCACKWTVVYAGVGLALLWLLGMILKGREWKEAERAARLETAPPEVQAEVTKAMFQEAPPPWERTRVPSFAAHAALTTLLSVVFFVLIPVLIYSVSFFPYALARGNEAGFWGMLGQCFAWPFTEMPKYLATLPEYMAELAKSAKEGEKTTGLAATVNAFFKQLPDKSSNPMEIMLRNQHFMFTYHQGVHNHHPYESYWYQWIFDGRPILYYRDLDVPGMRSLFASFNNPLVSWLGLLSFFGVAVQTVRRKCGKGLFILIAILSQFVPWLGIGRILFAYHYFPTILFLCFAISYLMDDILTRNRKGSRLAVYGFTGCAVGLYVIFYPVLIGLYVPNWYSKFFVQWFPSWPL